MARIGGSSGFTLIEVLVALLIVGIAFSAIMGTAGVSVDALGDTKRRLAALYVAQNRLAVTRVDSTGENPVFPGVFTGIDKQSSTKFYWRETVTRPPGYPVTHVVVEVFPDDRYKASLATLQGYVLARIDQ